MLFIQSYNEFFVLCILGYLKYAYPELSIRCNPLHRVYLSRYVRILMLLYLVRLTLEL